MLGRCKQCGDRHPKVYNRRRTPICLIARQRKIDDHYEAGKQLRELNRNEKWLEISIKPQPMPLRKAGSFDTAKGSTFNLCHCCGKSKLNRQLYTLEEHRICATCRDKILKIVVNNTGNGIPLVFQEGSAEWH